MQRKGQKLINYARFVKGCKEAMPPTPCENFIWNMSDDEFEKAMNYQWEDVKDEDISDRVGKIIEILETQPEELWTEKMRELGVQDFTHNK